MRLVLPFALIVFALFLVDTASARPTAITFNEFPLGTTIDRQYEALGINFHSSSSYGHGWITTDARFASSPVLTAPYSSVGSRLGFTFVTPDLNYRAITSFSFDFGMIVPDPRIPNFPYLDVTWWNQLAPGAHPTGHIRITKSGLSRVAINDSNGFTTVSLDGPDYGDDEFNWRIDNVMFDALDGGTCPTTVSALGVGESCSCNNADKDAIIAEYTKSYGKDKVGTEKRIFDVNIDTDGLKNGLLPESLFVPTCDMFTQRLRTAHYTFKQIKDGIGDCGPKHLWALIANALADTSESGRGLDRWAELIKADKFKYNGKLITQKKGLRLA